MNIYCFAKKDKNNPPIIITQTVLSVWNGGTGKKGKGGKKGK